MFPTISFEALKRSEPTVRLRVTHEPQPSGLREVILRRSCGEPLGLRICGGINSPPANPLDKTDEGIFVEKVSCRYIHLGIWLTGRFINSH